VNTETRVTESYFEDVAWFHRKFGLPVAGPDVRCAPMTAADAEYRTKFLEEELTEFKLALLEGDLPGMTDALADLVWVALGTAHWMGAPFEAVWLEVARANMDKARGQPGDGGHRRGAAEPIRKPASWRPPDVAGAIAAHNARVRDRSKHVGPDYFRTPGDGGAGGT
jgi:predicted HAD superfamily Cof-like phosphohydrolase